MADVREEGLKLSKSIELYKRKESFNPSDYSKELNAENEWEASFLYASLQLHTDLQLYHTITKDKVYETYNSFHQETGFTVDADGFFKRNWLRTVNQKVNISKVIRYGVFDIDKVADLKNEFSFLSDLLNNHQDANQEFISCIRIFISF